MVDWVCLIDCNVMAINSNLLFKLGSVGVECRVCVELTVSSTSVFDVLDTSTAPLEPGDTITQRLPTGLACLPLHLLH